MIVKVKLNMFTFNLLAPSISPKPSHYIRLYFDKSLLVQLITLADFLSLNLPAAPYAPFAIHSMKPLDISFGTVNDGILYELITPIA